MIAVAIVAIRQLGVDWSAYDREVSSK